MATYSELIEQLSEQLGIEIFPNINNVVVLLIEKTIKIHIEKDVDDTVIIGSSITDLAPGKFREHILKDALIINSSEYKNRGTLSYMGSENSLFIHQKSPLSNLTANKMVQIIKNICKRSEKWKNTVNEGHSSPLDEMPAAVKKKSPLEI